MADQRTFADDAMPIAPQLFGTALRMTRNRADAEDLVQDTMLKAFKDKYAALGPEMGVCVAIQACQQVRGSALCASGNAAN